MNLVQFHRDLSGCDPTDLQRSLYVAAGRGYNTSGLDEERFLAVFILALGSAQKGLVVVAVPKALEKAVLQAMEFWARKILRRFRGQEIPVKAFTERVKKLRMANRLLIQMEEPERWVAIGLTKDDLVPQWLQSKLV